MPAHQPTGEVGMPPMGGWGAKRPLFHLASPTASQRTRGTKRWQTASSGTYSTPTTHSTPQPAPSNPRSDQRSGMRSMDNAQASRHANQRRRRPAKQGNRPATQHAGQISKPDSSRTGERRGQRRGAADNTHWRSLNRGFRYGNEGGTGSTGTSVLPPLRKCPRPGRYHLSRLPPPAPNPRCVSCTAHSHLQV